MIKIGYHNLNKEYLRSAIVDAKSWGLPEDTLYLIACFEIVVNALSPKFIKREFGVETLDGSHFKKIDEPYFYEIACNIWDLKKCKGFADFIKSLNSRDKNQLYSELCFARMFFDQSESIEFVVESDVKESDFDLKLKNFKTLNGAIFETLNLEVKSKAGWFSSGNQVTNLLNKKRKQLPNDQNGSIGLLFESLPVNHKEFPQSNLDEAIAKFLGNTNRVAFVTYCWRERHFKADGNRATGLYYRVIDKHGVTEPYLGFYSERGTINRFFQD